jgi:phosphinothricin acetyltransferase
MEIAPASPADAEAIAAIYAHHVLHGTASFETEPPTAGSWREKIGAVAARGWPFLAAKADGQIVGYAYAMQFRDRPAYRYTCENSIYVDHRRLGEGIGRQLLDALIEEARRAGFREMIAVVGGAEPASIGLHEACGFVKAGRMHGVGHKFGRWLDTVYMQRRLRND